MEMICLERDKISVHQPFQVRVTRGWKHLRPILDAVAGGINESVRELKQSGQRLEQYTLQKNQPRTGRFHSRIFFL